MNILLGIGLFIIGGLFGFLIAALLNVNDSDR